MRRRICFLVGSVAMSGGTYVIFQHASHLRDHGYEVTLAVQEPFGRQTAGWHDKGLSLRCLPFHEARHEAFDLVIATWWKTALDLPTFNAPRYAYFVQSIESRFYPQRDGPLRALADASYLLPVPYVTEASWIVHYLTHNGHQATLVRNGIRKDIYSAVGPVIEPRPAGQPRVLVEGHFNVAFKNTALALKLARDSGARDIWVMTGSPVRHLPGASRVFSRVPVNRTPEIYRSCDILLKLSTVEGMFGPPLEMFHCGGTAVVFDVTGHDEYITAGQNAVVVAQRDPREVVAQLRALLSDPARVTALKSCAADTARLWPGWTQSSTLFADWIEDVLRRPATDRDAVSAAVEQAWARYHASEQQRLRDNPSIGGRYRLESLARRIPPALQTRMREIGAIAEVLHPSRRVS